MRSNNVLPTLLQGGEANNMPVYQNKLHIKRKHLLPLGLELAAHRV